MSNKNTSIRISDADQQAVLPLFGPWSTPLRVLDLYAGAGGLALGFEKLFMPCGCPAYELIVAAEKDRDACATLRANHPRIEKDGELRLKVIEDDLAVDTVRQQVVDAVGDGGIDIIIGGPPCQSYSQIGTRTGKWVGSERSKEDERDSLFEHYVDLVRELLPKYLVLENVDGIRSKKNGDGKPYLSVIIEKLEALGYTFLITGSQEKFLKLNAADFGVPQIRNRVFLIGNRLGVPFRPPVPTHRDPCHPSGTTQRLPWVNLREAIGDLPVVLAHYTPTHLAPEAWALRSKENERRNHGSNDDLYHEQRFAEHYRNVTDQGRSFLDFIKPSGITRLRYHLARDQQVSDIELFRLMPEGTTAKDIFETDPSLAHLAAFIRYDMKSFKDKYRKQAWDRPCTTVFAHLDRDGNRFIHPDSTQARTFTVREAARVQSFPDDYLFLGGLKSRYRQIGNAVPPLLAMSIARAILDSLLQVNGIAHESCQAG